MLSEPTLDWWKMKKTLFFAITIIIALTISLTYYFFFFRVVVINLNKESNLQKVECISSSGKNWQIPNPAYKSEEYKFIHLGLGQRLECRFDFDKYESQNLLLVGYYGWEVKKISVVVSDKKIEAFDMSGNYPILIDKGDLMEKLN